MRQSATIDPCERLKLAVRGAVQGVGFRPFVFRLAAELELCGWVNNSPQGVFIEVEGARPTLEQFLVRLVRDKPPRSFIQNLESAWLDAVGYPEFEIRESATGGGKTALILPDIATCPDCLREILDPANRRYHYPFTNCTNCGPRFSILNALPYDRAHTSMKSFRMCPACQAEYDNPHDRRFHAQPNACPECGPQLELWPGVPTPWKRPGRGQDGEFEPPRRLAQQHDAVLAAAHVIRCGQIVAVKGIGGFNLLADARNEPAVRRLRERKHREEKPFALMFPSLESVKAVCEVSPLEERLLCSPEAPIVLLRKLVRPHLGPLPPEREYGSAALGESARAPFLGPPQAKPDKAETRLSANEFQGSADSRSLSPGERVRVRASVEQTFFEISAAVAPGNPNLGVMLPSNPIHHLLMAELGFPVVATSGNLSDEPICIDNPEALERLAGIADVFLVHNRPIVRHVDDSVVRGMLDRAMVLRRARGYAPLPITLPPQLSTLSSQPILAVGAHLKNSVALAVGEHVFLSQHIGDLETEQANRAFRRVAADLPRLYAAKPEVMVADLHPDYLSTQFAAEPARGLGNIRQVPPEGGGIPKAAPQVIRVQHHIAHVLSCMADNEVELPALGVAWDGTGYGTDGTIWGGEFFRVAKESIERIAHLRTFRLPGGDAAVQEPRRVALGLLHELAAAKDCLWSQLRPLVAPAFLPAELATLEAMLERNINSPRCSSIGRLFDAVASLVNLRQHMQFEGQAAMELEFALDSVNENEAYPLPLVTRPASLVLDWAPLIEALLTDVNQGIPVSAISWKFHNALAEAIVAVAKTTGERRVVLSGGCFQNRYLTERTIRRLRAEGFQPYWHQRLPPNDGGIALGQIVAARRELAKRGAALAPHQRPTDEPLLFPNETLVTTLKPTEIRAPVPQVTQHAAR